MLGIFFMQVNEGRVPEDRFALRILAEEMNNWPNLEVLLMIITFLFFSFITPLLKASNVRFL